MHSKEVLAEFIYKLNEETAFLLQGTTWSYPCVGFLYNHSLPSSFMRDLENKKILKEDVKSVICVLGDWQNVAEGIVFTDQAIYVASPKNKEDKKFRLSYNEIKETAYYTNPELDIVTDWGTYIINTPIWNKRNIHDFLEFAREAYEFTKKNKEIIMQIELGEEDGKSVGAIAAGITYGNISNASSLYFDDKILTPRGHGFAAEHANHLADLYEGKKARIVGDDNAKNGADRIVEGVNIQSKYCASGSKCVQECFEMGKFRYWNPDGSPMQIEVPADMYESAVQAMQNRIDRGEVPGVTDATDIIRKGNFTYQQVKNIAKAGTIESICYDAASGAIVARNAFGVTTVLTFATAIWNGEDLNVALKSAAAQGIKVGGTTFITAVLAGQLSKVGLNSALVGSSEAIVGVLGPKASAVLINAFRSGSNIYGAAAMKSAAKMLRGNVITGIASFAILSIGDVGNIFQGRISGGQLFKNMATTASTVAGGGMGWTAGAAAGAAVGSMIPGIGTAIGGMVGGLLGAFGGGSIASGVSSAVLDEFIEDDAERMVRLIQDVFTELAEEYLTTQKEAERIADQLKNKLTGGLLKDMYASDSRKGFARKLLVNYFEKEANNRDYIRLPSDEQMKDGIKMVLENIAESDYS